MDSQQRVSPDRDLSYPTEPLFKPPDRRIKVPPTPRFRAPVEPSSPVQDEALFKSKPKKQYACKRKPNGRGKAWAKGEYRPPPPGGYQKGERKVGDEALIAALEACRGNKSAAARKVGLHPVTVFKYIAESPHLQERLREIEEHVGDYVEDRLMEAIDRGDVTATVFYCRTKLRRRGFVYTEDANQPQQLSAAPTASELVLALEQVLERRREREQLTVDVTPVPLIEANCTELVVSNPPVGLGD